MLKALAVLLLAEFCGSICTGSAWELRINGFVVSGLGDMTKEECTEAANEIAPQVVPYFYKVECAEIGIKRETS